MPSAAMAGLSVAIPGFSGSSHSSSASSLGGRSSFAINPYRACLSGCSHTADTPKDNDEEVMAHLCNLVQNVSLMQAQGAAHTSDKHHHEGDDDEDKGEEDKEDGGSEVEDMMVTHGHKSKSRQSSSPAKSGKKESATAQYSDEDI